MWCDENKMEVNIQSEADLARFCQWIKKFSYQWQVDEKRGLPLADEKYCPEEEVM